MKDLRLIWICLVALLPCAAMAYSQAVNATQLGTVTDITGAVVPNAQLTITQTNTGARI